MDELEGRLFLDMRNELVMCKYEKQRLSEKLDCLIILLRRAWHGESESIEKLSEIIGTPSPKIIPCEKEIAENHLLSHEYLQITSSLLDAQLKNDSTIRKNTKTLRPSSGKLRKPLRLRSAPTQRSRGLDSDRSQTAMVGRQISNPPLMEKIMHSSPSAKEFSGGLGEVDYLAMPELAEILPMFSPRQSTSNTNLTLNQDHKRVAPVPPKVDHNRDIKTDLFNPDNVVGPRKARPISAALQQRQDYLRSQNKRTKRRPASAKPAFEFTEVDPRQQYASANELLVSPRHDMDEESHHSISVDISTKGGLRKRVNAPERNVFPHERDMESYGDVSDALQRVQEMQQAFRRNARRLQQKIGIPEAGCV